MNHVDDIPKMFDATFRKFLGDAVFKELLKRQAGQEREERMDNFRKAVIIVEDINDDRSTPYSAQINKIAVMTNAEKDAMLNLNATELHEVSTRGERVHLESGNSPKTLIHILM